MAEKRNARGHSRKDETFEGERDQGSGRLTRSAYVGLVTSYKLVFRQAVE